MVGLKPNLPSWTSFSSTRVDFETNVSSASDSIFRDGEEGPSEQPRRLSDANLSFGERSLSAAGAAFLSAILVNPLDVAKTRLQAQAAGVPYQGQCRMTSLETNTVIPNLRCSSVSSSRSLLGLEPNCSPECNRYTGTFDVFNKVIRQEGFRRLWRGTYASLTLAVPTVGIYMPCYDIFRNLMEDFTTKNAPSLTPYVPLVAGSTARSLAVVSLYPIELARTRMQAFREKQTGTKPPGVWKTLVEVVNPTRGNRIQDLQNYRLLWTGLGAQIARDVPFSAICWTTLEPLRRKILGLVGEEANAASVLGANFSAGFIAGSLAAAATCPLDVAKTRRQIERDPERALNMTTRTTLAEIWRDGRIKGMFTGVGPRVGRAGPSVGIVVSFYEVIKYALYHRHPKERMSE
ncbi:mitochondrial carrier protein MTM1 isoform X1 [Cucumis sativus]|uniref:Mitochondrial carrier protein n=1 Tax=Cucumis sativus TaxID=3659 RepID=A0A0A0L8P7_CUCSA|nr:mitochondrial carrier protein MTM1 isoform X1 [Cucumis sativus]XP_031738939.1 mitochondrial carrier protein MTM1 isoform X1 [Cucumis sativus]